MIMNRLIVQRFLAIATALGAGLAACVAVATPVQAGVGNDVGGHVWGWNPTAASYTISPPYDAYAANDGGGDIVITRSGTGRYLVRWAGLGAAAPPGGGIAHASAYGTNSHLCTVPAWWHAGSDVYVQVYCFNSVGAPADTYFTANYVAAEGVDPLKYYSYVWADRPTTASYAPSATYRYDARGITPWVYRDGVGNYRVYLPSTQTYPDQVTTFYQTTAYGTAPVSCKVVGYLGGGMVRVHCRNVTGAMVDARFSLTFTTQNLLLRIAPTSMSHVVASATRASITWSNDSSVAHLHAVTRLGVGVYRIYFPQIMSPYGHAVARATGGTDSRCHVTSWYPFGITDEIINVRCVSASTGAAVDSPFVVAFTW